MNLRTLLLLALAAGCDSGPGAADAAIDLENGPDFAVEPFCMVTGSHHQRFYLNSITLPMVQADFAIDLNGDGHADNKLGSIIGALTSQGSDPQGTLNSALAKGTEVLLIDEASGDPTFTSDTCAGANLYKGSNQQPVNGDAGAQNYQIDTSVNPGLFTGPITTGTFSSSSPASPPDIQMTLFLPVYGTTLTALPVHGGHLQFSDVNGSVAGGQINGAIKGTDVQTILIPVIADGFEATVKANPNSSQAKQIKLFFDLGDGNGNPCTNPDGTMGAPNDGVISLCEIMDSMLIQGLLASDVQLFQDGVYAPNPANATKDSLSIGIAFTAEPATF